MTNTAKKIIAAIAAIPLALGIASCSTTTSSSSETATTVKIGVADASKAYWTTLKDLAAKEDITLDVVGFTDYQQPNPALTDGSLDINQFQHLLFLANYNENAGQDLTPIGATFVYPLGLYSSKHTALADIPQGGSVAIPNDATNQSRALLVLQGAGLISLKDGGTAFSTPDDIIADQSKVQVTTVNANQTANSLQDVDAAVINQNYLKDAGIDATSALYSDADSNLSDPYINVFAVRAADKDNPTLLKIVELYNTPEITDQVKADSDGTAVQKTDVSAADLQSILATLQEQIRAAS